MKIVNYLLSCLIALVICSCQKNEMVDSTIGNDLPQVLAELSEEYGVQITESVSRAENAEILSLDEIKDRLNFFKALSRDTIWFKNSTTDQNALLETSTRSLPFQDLPYYATEYITTPEGVNDFEDHFPESYINVRVELTTQFSQMRFKLKLSSINSTYVDYTDLVRNYLVYHDYTGFYDLDGAIRIIYYYQSLETGNTYRITGKYAIKGSINVSSYELIYISFSYTDPW